MIRPLTPLEASASQHHSYADWIIEAFNALIIDNLYKGKAEFTSNDVKDFILEKNPTLTIDDLERESYTGACFVFEAAGWEVDRNCDESYGRWETLYKYTFSARVPKIKVE